MMTLLVSTLKCRFGILKEDSIFSMDSKIKEELEIKKEGLRNTSSQLPFKVEAKVDIKPYDDEVDVIKVNHWLQKLKVYFSVH
jgi:hypothetical protein